MSGLTGTHIQKMLSAAGASSSGLVTTPAKLATLFNDAMLKYGDGLFTSTNRVAALLSECMVESAWFRTSQEYASQYQNAYKPYIGRTAIQVTWKTNYAAFGKWAKAKGLITDANYFVNNPSKLADLKWFPLGPVWYFTHVKFSGKPLVEFADNIKQVGRAVNNGNPYSTTSARNEAERTKAYNAVRSIGSGIVPSPPPGNVPDTGTKDKTVTETIAIHPTAGTIHTKWGARGPYWSYDRDKNGNGIHTGDDWHRNAGKAEQGDPIYAVADGRVIYAGDARKDSGGWGSAFGIHTLITWDKKQPGESFYRTSIDGHHCKMPAVKYGQHVKAGDLIGWKGMTGNVTGVHVHHEQHAGQHWGDKRLKPVYPGRTITKTIEQEGVPVMAKPQKWNRTKAGTIKKSKAYHTIALNNAGTAFSMAAGPGTVYVTADIVTDKDCWARLVTVNKNGKTVKYSSRYSRIKIKAGGDQIVWWDTIGGPAKGFKGKYVRLQILAYSYPVVLKSVRVRAGKEA